MQERWQLVDGDARPSLDLALPDCLFRPVVSGQFPEIVSRVA